MKRLQNVLSFGFTQPGTASSLAALGAAGATVNPRNIRGAGRSGVQALEIKKGQIASKTSFFLHSPAA